MTKTIYMFSCGLSAATMDSRICQMEQQRLGTRFYGIAYQLCFWYGRTPHTRKSGKQGLTDTFGKDAVMDMVNAFTLGQQSGNPLPLFLLSCPRML